MLQTEEYTGGGAGVLADKKYMMTAATNKRQNVSPELFITKQLQNHLKEMSKSSQLGARKSHGCIVPYSNTQQIQHTKLCTVIGKTVHGNSIVQIENIFFL